METWFLDFVDFFSYYQNWYFFLIGFVKGLSILQTWNILLNEIAKILLPYGKGDTIYIVYSRRLEKTKALSVDLCKNNLPHPLRPHGDLGKTFYPPTVNCLWSKMSYLLKRILSSSPQKTLGCGEWGFITDYPMLPFNK